MEERVTKGKASRNAKMFEAFQKGASVHTLAAEHGVSTQRVWQVVAREARRRGVALREKLPPRRPPARYTEVPKELAAAYVAGEMSRREISVRMGCGLTTVEKLLKGVRRTHTRTRAWAIYTMFKEGATYAELMVRFKVSKVTVSVSIHRSRKYDASPVCGIRGRKGVRVPA